MAEKTCRSCKWFIVPPGPSGKVRIKKDEFYRCICPVPDLKTILPEAITRAYGFKQPGPYGRVRADMGENCPTHTPKKDTDNG